MNDTDLEVLAAGVELRPTGATKRKLRLVCVPTVELATGRLKILTGAMAREITTDDEGLATGVSYVETATGREVQVRARVVVLAASACESARLLLNSRSRRHPQGSAGSIHLSHRCASHVGAVTVAIHRVQIALVGRAQPVSRVDRQATWLAAAILCLQGRVLPVYTRIHHRHCYSAAIQPQRIPCLISSDPGDVSRRNATECLALLLRFAGQVNPTPPAVLADDAHVGPGS